MFPALTTSFIMIMSYLSVPLRRNALATALCVISMTEMLRRLNKILEYFVIFLLCNIELIRDSRHDTKLFDITVFNSLFSGSASNSTLYSAL